MEGDTYIGLDLASTVGYAKSVDGLIVSSGSVSLYQAGEHRGDRWKAFYNFLVENCSGATEIFYEKVMAHAGWASSMEVFHGLKAFLELFARNGRIRLTGIAVNTLKKEFTGSGVAKKAEICAVCHRLGWKGGESGTAQDNDEADALAALIVGLRRYGIEPRFQDTP